MTLQRLRGLIVSIQPEPESVLNTPATVALFAQCAVANGASGVRIEGAGRIAAVRAAVGVPIVGLIKRVYPGFEPYITPTVEEIDAIVAAGAEVIAFDATPRARPGGYDVPGLVAAIHARGALAMADCATGAEARAAAAAGADVVGHHALRIYGRDAWTRLAGVRRIARGGRHGSVRNPRRRRGRSGSGQSRIGRGSLGGRRGNGAHQPRCAYSSVRRHSCATEVRAPRTLHPVQSEKVVRTSMENGVAFGIVTPLRTAAC